jgi:hypothetical protein
MKKGNICRWFRTFLLCWVPQLFLSFGIDRKESKVLLLVSTLLFCFAIQYRKLIEIREEIGVGGVQVN